MRDIAVDTVFLGSCTNGRMEDLRAAAEVLRGRQVAPGVRALVVPGLDAGEAQAEQEGLDEVFRDAGLRLAQRRLLDVPGHEPRRAAPGERCASTSNRNFEGRQGRGGRTHLVSPAGGRRHRRRSAASPPPPTCRRPDVEPFTTHTGRAVPLRRSDVDTDQIIPSDWLKRVERTGFGAGLFSQWREDPAFVLNRPECAGATVLLAGQDFGTGSSREHAVWALQDYGFRAVVSPRFARHLPQQRLQGRAAAGAAAR